MSPLKSPFKGSKNVEYPNGPANQIVHNLESQLPTEKNTSSENISFHLISMYTQQPNQLEYTQHQYSFPYTTNWVYPVSRIIINTPKQPNQLELQWRPSPHTFVPNGTWMGRRALLQTEGSEEMAGSPKQRKQKHNKKSSKIQNFENEKNVWFLVDGCWVDCLLEHVDGFVGLIVCWIGWWFFPWMRLIGKLIWCPRLVFLFMWWASDDWFTNALFDSLIDIIVLQVCSCSWSCSRFVWSCCKWHSSCILGQFCFLFGGGCHLGLTNNTVLSWAWSGTCNVWLMTWWYLILKYVCVCALSSHYMVNGYTFPIPFAKEVSHGNNSISNLAWI